MIPPPTSPRVTHDDRLDTAPASLSDLVIIVPDGTPPALPVENPSATSLNLSSQSPASTDAQSGHLLRPIPTPSVNASQASFSFSDATAGDNDGGALFDPLSPEIASADISIARECFP